MPTKQELKQLASPAKLKVRRGDKVVIIAGKDKGKQGYIAYVAPKENKVIVMQDNPNNPDQPLPLNAAVKHFKSKNQYQQSMRLTIPSPLHVSNVMVIDPATGTPSRIGRKKEDGKLVRYSKKSGQVIKDAPIYNKAQNS